MASVYILYSEKLDRYYTGSCKDIDLRLEDHRQKRYKDSFTVKAEDWDLFWSVDELTYDQCRLIEAHIKKMKSKQYIQNLKKYPDILERLKQLK